MNASGNRCSSLDDEEWDHLFALAEGGRSSSLSAASQEQQQQPPPPAVGKSHWNSHRSTSTSTSTAAGTKGRPNSDETKQQRNSSRSPRRIEEAAAAACNHRLGYDDRARVIHGGYDSDCQSKTGHGGGGGTTAASSSSSSSPLFRYSRSILLGDSSGTTTTATTAHCAPSSPPPEIGGGSGGSFCSRYKPPHQQEHKGEGGGKRNRPQHGGDGHGDSDHNGDDIDNREATARKGGNSSDRSSRSDDAAAGADDGCGHCREPRGAHLLKVGAEPATDHDPADAIRAAEGADDSGDAAALLFFCAVRNVRCWCRLQITTAATPSAPATTTTSATSAKQQRQQDWRGLLFSFASVHVLKRQRRVLLLLLRRQQQQQRAARGNTASDNNTSIDNAMTELLAAVDAILLWTSTTTNNNNATKAPTARTAAAAGAAAFDRCIRCIMACDAAYYRLYYQHLVSSSSLSSSYAEESDTTTTSPPFAASALLVPHPVVYFGEWEAFVTMSRNRRKCVVAVPGNDRGSSESKHNRDYDEDYDSWNKSSASSVQGGLVRIRDLNNMFGPGGGEGSGDYNNLDGTSDEEEDRSENVLTVLHRLRQQETIALFSLSPLSRLWRDGHNSKKNSNLLDAFEVALTSSQQPPPPGRGQQGGGIADAHEEELHGTVAPALLKEWRDSCRVFLCHLYSYATIPNAVLRRCIRAIIATHRSSSAGMSPTTTSLRLVEMGAGTGYLARLLETTCDTNGSNNKNPAGGGVSVTAYDAAPDSSNEYHAATPPFWVVHRATVQDTSAYYCETAPTATSSSTRMTKKRKRKKPKQQQRDEATPPADALLLCYPPPDDPMAATALGNFLQQHNAYYNQRNRTNDGSNTAFLIHVGEFKGLTGNADFERVLLHEMECIGRWPCRTWGTDATHMTLWKRKQQQQQRHGRDSSNKRIATPKPQTLVSRSLRRQ
jgi:hypothetical protein